MKKIIVVVALIIVIGGFAYWSSIKSSVPVATNTTSTSTSTSTTAAASSGSSGTTGFYKDGTYTGSVADAYYGNMQIAAIIAGGKIITISFLQYPKDQQESIQINAKSNPILISEAIAAQSAKVNVVSGATQSSEAFEQSLASALTQAQS